jgi:hypothetical protein
VLTVATAVLLLDHVPAEAPAMKVAETPAQSDATPNIEPALGVVSTETEHISNAVAQLLVTE